MIMNTWDDELCSSREGFRDWTLETLSPLLDLWEGGADIDPLDLTGAWPHWRAASSSRGASRWRRS